MKNLYDCCPGWTQLPFQIAKMKASFQTEEKQLYKNRWKYGWKYGFYKHSVGRQWTHHLYVAATTKLSARTLMLLLCHYPLHLVSGVPSSRVMTHIATSLTWILLWSPQLNSDKLHITPVIKSWSERVTWENLEHLSYCQTNVTAESLRTQITISAQKLSIKARFWWERNHLHHHPQSFREYSPMHTPSCNSCFSPHQCGVLVRWTSCITTQCCSRDHSKGW